MSVLKLKQNGKWVPISVGAQGPRGPAGTGDMTKAVYDPQGKAQDIFAYVDNAVSGVTVTTDATPTQGSTNPVQSGGVYTALTNKLDKTGDGSSVTAAFTAASSRENIATGENLGVLFGKIAKWFSDLGSLAFKSTVAKSDLVSAVQTSLELADTALQSLPSHNHDASAIDSGILPVIRGGTGVSSLDELATALGAARIQTGSYTGTGTYGASNPNSITFSFAPKIIFMRDNTGGTTYNPVFPQLLSTSYAGALGFISNNGFNIKKSSDGKTFTWYTTSTLNPPMDQCNESGWTYVCCAVG